MSRFNQEIDRLQGQITKMEIQKKRKDRINIHLDGEYAFSCHIDMVFEYKLDRGVTLSSSEVKALVEADDLKMAYLYGLKIALTRSISVTGCRRKLLQLEFDEPSVTAAIDRLLENNYLNDLRYAQNYYEMKQHIYGRFRIQQDLMRQGVDKGIVIQVVRDMADDDLELEEALRLAQRKYMHKDLCMDHKTYAKIYGFLGRRGYSASVIRQVMDQLRQQTKKEASELGI